MKTLLVLSILFGSTQAFAISDKNLISKCAPVGYLKILKHSECLNCTIVKDTFAAINIDNRTLNPYKYVMYEAQTECPNNPDVPSIKAITQYSSINKDCY